VDIKCLTSRSSRQRILKGKKEKGKGEGNNGEKGESVRRKERGKVFKFE
jgi:hypothetical protein